MENHSEQKLKNVKYEDKTGVKILYLKNDISVDNHDEARVKTESGIYIIQKNTEKIEFLDITEK
jgi:hypothetical protein